MTDVAPWFDFPIDEGDLELKDHEELCYACGLVKIRALESCGNCWGPSVHDKESVIADG